MDAALFQQDATMIALASLVLSLLAVVVLVLTLIRQAKLLRRYKLLLNGATEHDLESLLLSQGAKIDQLQEETSRTARRVEGLETAAKGHIQKAATIRFNAFPDTGSDLSFAIALLDGTDNGVVISSLYGRSESRIYAKPIAAGKSTYILSDEEKEALAKAMGTQKQP